MTLKNTIVANNTPGGNCNTGAGGAGVLAQFQKFFDIEVPGFQVGADCSLALAALVHGHGGVVDDFQKRHHALRFAVSALDVRTQS